MTQPASHDRVELVALRGMRFHVKVGILPHEKQFGQPLDIDVEVIPTGRDLLDYREIYEATRAAMAAEPLGYLEDAGRQIIATLLGNPAAQSVRVVIRKPHVPLPGPLTHAEVVVSATREG